MKKIIPYITIIFAVLINLFASTIRHYKRDKRLQQKNANVEKNIVSQIELLEKNYNFSSEITEDKLFSPKKMKNGGIDINSPFDVIDYTSNVPWFFRV